MEDLKENNDNKKEENNENKIEENNENNDNKNEENNENKNEENNENKNEENIENINEENIENKENKNEENNENIDNKNEENNKIEENNNNKKVENPEELTENIEKLEEDLQSDRITRLLKMLLSLKKGNTTQQMHLKEITIKRVLQQAYQIIEKEPVQLELTAPIIIVGDIHGQYYDLLRIFECLKTPSEKRFLFLGDYVDRGKQSIETILLLLCFKIKYPNNIFLLRGNHESAPTNKIYGFFDECKRRVNIRIWKTFTEFFNILPITALIEKKILCMHGGLSYEIYDMKYFKEIKRPTEIPNSGLLGDLLWSGPSSELYTNWGPNERGLSYTFSKDVVEKFVRENDLDLICRAHQVVEEGFEFFANMKMVTIFSAPNYMGEFDNNGGMLEVDENLLCRFHIIAPKSEVKKKKKEHINKLIN